MEDQKLNPGIRLVSMFIDHFIMTFVAMVFAVPSIVMSMSAAFGSSTEFPHDQVPMSFGSLMYISLIGIAVYICKDCIQGRSMAKRILKLQLVDASGKAASPLRCLVRNFFMILWPIEGIVALANPERRIGDMVAGTRLVHYNPEPPSQTNFPQAVLAFVIAYALLYISTMPVTNLLNQVQTPTYDEASFNQEKSQALQNHLNDNLGEYFTADIRIYDQLMNQEDSDNNTVIDEQSATVPYLSIVLYLHENYLEDDDDASQLSDDLRNSVRQLYPSGSCVGQVKMIYRSDYGSSSLSFPI